MANNIFVIGYYGYDNIGDDAMQQGLSEIFKYRTYGDLRFYHKGQSLIKGFLWADDIVLGGGTHLRDWGKGWLKQSARILLLGLISKLSGKDFYMFNVGIESSWLGLLAHCISDEITIRDENSFDSSVVLNYEPKIKQKILGISLTPYYKLFYNDENKDRLLANNLIEKVKKWLSFHNDWNVVFFNFNKSDEGLNFYAYTLIDKAEVRLFKKNVVNVLQDISECSAFIGMRYHSSMFAYITETPMVIIDTYPSCSKLSGFIGANLITKEKILNGNFELDFVKAKLSVATAKSLAFGGVKL